MGRVGRDTGRQASRQEFTKKTRRGIQRSRVKTKWEIRKRHFQKFIYEEEEREIGRIYVKLIQKIG